MLGFSQRERPILIGDVHEAGDPSNGHSRAQNTLAYIASPPHRLLHPGVRPDGESSNRERAAKAKRAMAAGGPKRASAYGVADDSPGVERDGKEGAQGKKALPDQPEDHTQHHGSFSSGSATWSEGQEQDSLSMSSDDSRILKGHTPTACKTHAFCLDERSVISCGLV